MDLRDELINLGKELKEKSQFMHKKLYRAPQGSILIVKDDEYLKLYQLICENGAQKRIGIKNKPEVVRALARKAFYSEEVKRIDDNLNILREAVAKVQPTDYDTILRCMPKNYELLDEEYFKNWTQTKMHPVYDNGLSPVDFKLYIPEEERDEWGTIPYKANSLFKDQIPNRTEEGFYIRSKNEMSIFSCYNRLEIPVHYDELVRFNGSVKSPDFISVREDGMVIYHEHCGRVNDPEYMKSHKEKIELYENCGIVPYRNLIVTYENEDGGINMKLIEAQIRAMHKR